MNKYYGLFLLLLTMLGCSQLNNMDELLVLKLVAKEQKGAAQYIEKQNGLFERLLQEYEDGHLKDYKNQSDIVKVFGDPVLKKREENGNGSVWLYRYATNFFDSDKIYFYFDEYLNLSRWEFFEGKTKHQ